MIPCTDRLSSFVSTLLLMLVFWSSWLVIGPHQTFGRLPNQKRPIALPTGRLLSDVVRSVPSDEKTRIVGGSPADPGAYPFMAALYQYEIDIGVPPACGGSLITSSVILTAAHCISSVKAVELNRYTTSSNLGVERFTNLTKRVHPGYSDATVDFDIGLIRLPRPHRNPSLVALRQTPEIPENLTIMGWGLTSYLGVNSDVLLDAQVKRVGTDECIERYPSEEITSNMMCFAEQGTDSCQGDSGGPAVIVGQNVQVGVVSWGYACADSRFPGVYARIDKVHEWIERTTCNDLSPDDCIDGKLPPVNAEGKALGYSCDDRPVFLGLGKKLKIRDCTWVGERPERRCRWYGDRYCPQTCRVDRCITQGS